jgi:hypothetical protein
VPSALITVVSFGRVSAPSTRLDAALLREDSRNLLGHPPGRRPAFGIDDVRARSSSAASMAGQVGDQVVTKLRITCKGFVSTALALIGGGRAGKHDQSAGAR